MPEAGEIPGGAPIREAIRTTEAQDSRETVINAFNSAYSIFENTPEDRLTPEQQAARDLIKDIKAKTLDKGTTFYVNKFKGEGGKDFSQREYLPVDELIIFLRERIKSGELTVEDETEYRNLERILHKNSQEYYRGSAKKEFSRKIGRITQEANRISADPRLTTGNPHDDFLEAGRILLERRELIIPLAAPPKEGPLPTAPESNPESETEPEPARREVMIINRTGDIERRARELAQEQLRNEMRRGNALNPLNWPRKIGLRIMEEFHRQRYIIRSRTAMLENNNSYLSMDVVRNADINAAANLFEERQAGQSKIEQIKTGELIEGQRVQEAEGELRNAIIEEILRPVVDGTITEYGQVQELLRNFVINHQNDPQVQALFGRDVNEYGRLAEYFATDLLEAGQLIKQDLEAHRYGIEQLDNIVKIQLANTSWAAETQERLSAVDRAVRWVERHRLTGTLINPATIGAGFSLATFTAMKGLGVSARTAQFLVPGAGLLPGALFAAVRRNYDLKIDRATHQIERAYNMRLDQGARRREALEQFSYNTASVNELINGGGQELLTGTDRLSLSDLLSQDLSEGQTANREALIRRIAEIKARLDFSSRERVDLITYEAREQVEQGRLQLIKHIVDARQALRNAGMDEAEIAEVENRFIGEWNSRFTQNVEQQDRAFAHYRLRNALGAAAFGGIAGLGAGFLVQEGIALGERASGFSAGHTVIEKGIHRITGLLGQHREGGTPRTPDINNFRDLYNQGGTAELPNNIQVVINPADHSATFINETGKTIAHGNLGADGILHNIVAGDGLSRETAQHFSDQLSQSGLVIQMHETAVAGPSIASQIQEAVAQHKPSFEVHQGNIDLLVQGQSGHVTIHDALTNTTILGKVSSDGAMIFSQADNPNIDLAAIHRDLTAVGFGVDETHQVVAGAGIAANPIDTLLSLPPSELHAKGIVETDEFMKNWNFHVLRPDIVAATGEHTHNELTLHIGQYLDENGRWITGEKGLLNFGGDIKGDLIPSNLPGVPPMHDQVLDQLIASNGPIHHNDMVFVIDLNDGRQIMIGADNIGNAHLPQELFNPQTGELQGVKSIAAAILEKDGNVLRAGSVIQNGTIPEGTTVHSLASVALETPTPQVTPNEVLNVVAPSKSITATEFSFDIVPPVHETFKPPPIIPIPFAPRHPLESLLFLYGYGGGYSGEGLGWIDRSEYKTRRSKTLSDNPYARLDETQEVSDYLSRMDSGYRRELEKMDEIIAAPMAPETRVVITIPVFGEGKIIRKTLEQYLNQKDKNGNSINPNLFEIIVFENDTESRPKDEAEEEIRKFKTDHPEIKINYAYRRWGPDDIAKGVDTVGNARKYNCDLALLRSEKRGNRTGELIIVNNDADLEKITPIYIADIIEEFDKKDYLDTIVGKRNLPEWALKKPNIRAAQRTWEIFDSVMRHGAGTGIPPEERVKGWPGFIGENSAMRASIYAAVGGYIPTAKLAEDILLGDMIRAARNYDDRRFEYLNRLETIKNPRRYLMAMASGIPIYHMYGDYHENKEIRNLNIQDLLKIIPDVFDIDIFLKDVDAIWQGRHQFGHLGETFGAIFDRTMNFMGVKYKIENDHVVILNADKLIERLKRPIPSSNPPIKSAT